MGLRILGVIIPIIIIAFSYGVAVGLYEYFPYEGLNQTKKIILNENDEYIITFTDFANTFSKRSKQLEYEFTRFI